MKRILAVLASAVVLLVAQTPPSDRIDPDGTAHIVRVVPPPVHVSPQARKFLAAIPVAHARTLAENRARTDAFRVGRAEQARKLYPVKLEPKTIAGVRTDIITPLSPAKRDRILINVHGGVFVTDSGSLV